MTQPEFLQANDLHALTGYARAGQQAEWLKTKGIPFRQDGRRVIVSRIHVQGWLEGRTMVSSGGMNMAAIK